MQAARTVFLWPERNWLRKVFEAYYTVIIEIFWDKKRILEIYLNTVDWGGGVMGAEAASRKYFRTSSALVTPSQAASMAVILPHPHNWSPVNPDGHVKVRMERIMKDMARIPLR
jgi:monofunctional biosynthetic peptidoglycan transglycosylase